MNPQQQVHETLGLPLLGGLVCSEIPLYAERYFLHTTDLSVPPVDFMALLTQFGGSRADEGQGASCAQHRCPACQCCCLQVVPLNGTIPAALISRFFICPSALMACFDNCVSYALARRRHCPSVMVW